MRPDRANFGNTAPLDELLALLLRQFKRPLRAHDIDLSDETARTIAAQVVSRKIQSRDAHLVRTALIAAVAESEAVLMQWNLSFEQALATGMDQIPGWETTAEFLDIANEKSNAELRISTGSALVTALGDYRYLPHLLVLAQRGDDDVDTAIARRVLLFVSGVEDSAGWLDRVRTWYAQQSVDDSSA